MRPTNDDVFTSTTDFSEKGRLSAAVMLNLPSLNSSGTRLRRVSIGRAYGIGLESAKDEVATLRRDYKDLQIVAEFKVDL